jgi:hypothetical protein
MLHSHAVAWIDAKEAHVFRFNAEDVEKARIRAHSPYRKIHHKAGVIGPGHTHLDRGFLDEIGEALSGVEEWLLVGPGHAKDEVRRHIVEHSPELASRIVGVEAMDHPSDGELLRHARSMFKAVDRMRPNSPAPKHH